MANHSKMFLICLISRILSDDPEPDILSLIYTISFSYNYTVIIFSAQGLNPCKIPIKPFISPKKTLTYRKTKPYNRTAHR